MQQQPIKKTYRILLAEDDHGTVEFVTAALERYNFTVTHAGEGRAALRRLSEESFELMLCDVMMPHIDGFKALENARENRVPIPPVIMLTALHDQESVLRAKKLGAAGYLAKPCTATQLIAKVKATLELADEDLVDKSALPFTIKTSVTDNTLMLSLVGCPMKNPLGDLIKAMARVATLQLAFKAAEIQAGTDFLYAAAAFEYLKAMAGYLQKSYHISRPNIQFSGPFFSHADKVSLHAFKEDFSVIVS